MTIAAKLINDVRAAGGEMKLRDGQLKLKAASPLPKNLITALREHKKAVMAELDESKERKKADRRNIPWTSTDWHAHFEERIGIRMDDGLTEAEAKTGAQEDMIQEWLFQNPPEPNDGSTCNHCRKELGNAVALPFLAGRNGHVWLHETCWPDWFANRKRAAEKKIENIFTSGSLR